MESPHNQLSDGLWYPKGFPPTCRTKKQKKKYTLRPQLTQHFKTVVAEVVEVTE